MIFFILERCGEKDITDRDLKGESDTSVIVNQSLNFDKKINDSVNSWILYSIKKGKNGSNYIDETLSLICVHKKRGRLKTNGLWYFFKGNSVVLPKQSGHIKNEYPFSQPNKIALKYFSSKK